MKEYFDYEAPEMTGLTRLAVIAKGQAIPSVDVTEPEPPDVDDAF